MCTNQKLIFPKHSKRPMYVKCGHCPACLQEKAANRVRRINNTKDDSLACYMVTLTYSQHTAPYVLRDEAFDFSNGLIDSLNVYRDCSVRKVRKPSNFDDYNQVYQFKYQRVLLDTVDFDVTSSLKNTKDLKFEVGKLGVCYYKDYQHFIARLRLNLKRHYNYEGKLFVYACSEYGVKSLRPHFHLLIFIEKPSEASLRNAVYESWPFSNLRRFKRSVERCFKGASYVASYVNKSSNFPLFFENYFKTKHSYSKGFGLSNKKFSLDYILSKVEQGFIKYSVLKTNSGVPTICDVPIPAYVINRYFPKFKGYTTCSPCSLLSYMQRIVRGNWDLLYQINGDNFLFPTNVYSLSEGCNYLFDDELRKIQVRLFNAFERYKEFAPSGYSHSLDDYLQLHIRVWNCYNSSILRLHLQNTDIPDLEKYDNLDEVISRNIPIFGKFGYAAQRVYDSIKETNPNNFSSVRNHTGLFEQSYHETIKHRSVSNTIYLQDNECEL